MPVTTIRPCAAFGPYDRDFLSLFRLAEQGLMLYPGVERHWMSLLHVDDVVAGILAAATRPEAIGRTYFLASDAPVQWRALGEEIARVVGRPARHLNIPGSVVAAASALGASTR